MTSPSATSNKWQVPKMLHKKLQYTLNSKYTFTSFSLCQIFSSNLSQLIVYIIYHQINSTGSGRVFLGFGIWPKYGAGIGKTINILTGSGIWLFPGKRDSPKIGHGMRDLCLRVCRECRKPSRPTGSSDQSESTRQCVRVQDDRSRFHIVLFLHTEVQKAISFCRSL